MQLKIALMALVLSVLPLVASAQTTTIPNNTTYGAGSSPVVVLGPTVVTTGNNTVTVAGGATVTYQASGSINLLPGFRTYAGGNFYAMIGTAAGADTDGDGIPDAWERAHGLSPTNAADANNVAANGLTYLVSYQLGLNGTTGTQTDTGNTTQLKINRPTQ